MDWWLLTFFLGAVLSLFLHEVPTIFQLLMAFFVACLAIRYLKHGNFTALALGAVWLLTQAYLYNHQLPAELIELMQARKSVIVEGEVLSLQVNTETETGTDTKTPNIITPKNKSAPNKGKDVTKRFNFSVVKVDGQLLPKPINVRLSWKKPTVVIAQGQVLQLYVKLKPAHGLNNLGSFNYISWLKANNISATGYVKNPKKKNEQLQPLNHNKIVNANTTLRQALFNQYFPITPNSELKAILLALAFGERSLLTSAHWQVLQTTGTSHLIAISGLHVGLLATGCFYLVLLLIKIMPLRSPRWQCLNARYIAIAISLLSAISYAYLAGFSLPTQRALVMLIVYWLSRLLNIHLSPIRLLLLTVFIVVLISPFSLFTASFWLSFYAVAIIFLTLWRFKSYLTHGSSFWRFIMGLMVIQLSLTVMLIPITALFFQQISLVSIIANLIAVPWMSFITIPCTLFSLLTMIIDVQIAQVFISLALDSLTLLWQYLDYLTTLPNAVVKLSLYQQVLLTGIVSCSFHLAFLSLSAWKTKIKRLVSLMIIALSFFAVGAMKSSFSSTSDRQNLSENLPWEVVFFDVGQGLSVLIERNSHAILYDTGAAYPSGFTLSEAVILPYLQYSGITQLDNIILSHSDNDHAGGLATLLDNIGVDAIMSNDEQLVGKAIINASTDFNTKPLINSCYAGHSFNWQGLSFDILSPALASEGVIQSKAEESSRQDNDDSCVILVTDQQGRTLPLTGDISAEVEQKIMQQYPKLAIDILQVPHHGSKSSSSRDFLKQLAPQYAVVSAGYLNRWHMPVKSIRQRYIQQNIKILTSAEVGQVIISIDNKGVNNKNFVDVLRPFWFTH